jgi:hypothetical protein
MSVILHTDVNYMHFVHFLLKLKQVHNLKNRIFPYINMFFINLYTSIDRFLIRTRVKYPETLKGNNFKIPRSNFFKFGTVL